MILSLIGMSGSGKTYWAKQLEKAGFKRYSCEDLIEEKLGGILQKFGYKGINDLAKWMGQPYEPHYAETSRLYLQLEHEVMHEVFQLVKQKEGEKSIIDTTGSVIYASDKLLSELQSISKVIYLSTPQHAQEEMFKLYLTDPKPVIWGSSFAKQADESNANALRRCYPKLLAHRAEQYRTLADITMNYTLIRADSFTHQHFLERIVTYDQL